MGCGGVVRRVQEPSRTFASCTSDVPLSLVRGRVAASVSLDLECVVVLLVGVRMVASCPLPCSCVSCGCGCGHSKRLGTSGIAQTAPSLCVPGLSHIRGTLLSLLARAAV